jgi:two-component sensor histidine kinase
MGEAADHLRPRGRVLTLRARLVLLVLAFLVPGLLITGFLLWDLERAASQLQERQLTATARALALVVDRQIGEQAAVVQALATSPSLRSGDWRAFDAQARAAVGGHDSWVVVRATDTTAYVNTRLPFGAPIPPTVKGAVNPFWGGRRNGASVSNLYSGPLLPHPVVAVRRSVTLDNGQKVDLNVTTLASSFTQVFRDQNLPANWIGGILDANGRVVARSRDSDRYVGRTAPPNVLRTVRSRGTGMFKTATFDGESAYSAFDVLPGYDWSVLVAVPADEVEGAARRSLIAWLGVGTLLLSAAVLLSVRVASGIARPVERLDQAASDWVAGRPVVLPKPSGLPETDGLGLAFAAALAAVEARDAQQTLLINELNHRVKNTLATVQSIALHSRLANASPDAFHAAFEGRLMAMSGAHELLTQAAWEGAALDDVARSALRPFLGPRLTIAGPEVQIGPTTALNLSLIIYELATNAAKYGALSTERGQVDLTWRRHDDKVQVVWTESGGPPPTPPARKGFGSRLIERAARDLQPAALEFGPGGVRCMLTIDVAALDAVRGFVVSQGA